MAKLLYFGRMSDLTGMTEEERTLPNDVTTAGALRTWLDHRFEAAGALLEPTVQIAINNQLSFDTDHVSSDDEIAIMPPVGGG